MADDEGGISDPPAAGALHPARRDKRGESRIPPVVAIAVAIALYALLPQSLLIGPRFLIPALEAALLVAVVLTNPRRLTRETRISRYASLILTALVLVTNLVSLVRFALEADDELVPYPDRVNERFAGWLLQQQQAGRIFTAEQMAWLERIRDHLATSLHVTVDDLMEPGFTEHGGLGKASRLFGDELSSLLDQLEKELVA